MFNKGSDGVDEMPGAIKNRLIRAASQVLIRYGLKEVAIVMTYDLQGLALGEPFTINIGHLPELFFQLIDRGFLSVPHEIDDRIPLKAELIIRGVKEVHFFIPELIPSFTTLVNNPTT